MSSSKGWRLEWRRGKSEAAMLIHAAGREYALEHARRLLETEPRLRGWKLGEIDRVHSHAVIVPAALNVLSIFEDAP